jgi:peptidoglycan hydrolase CwlO-like protein
MKEPQNGIEFEASLILNDTKDKRIETLQETIKVMQENILILNETIKQQDDTIKILMR